MSSSVKMLKPVVAELSVDIPKEDVSAAMDRAYALVSRSAKVRGFRKGKAPRAVLRRMFGKAVRSDVQNELIGQHLYTALAEHKLDPISPPAIDSGEFDENSPFAFKVTFEIRPRVETVNYEGIEVERYKVTVTEKDVKQELERLRSAMASATELKDPRPAQKSDVAMISMKRWVDGQWDENPLPEQEVVLGERQAPEKLEEAIIGMNIDEEKVVDLGSASEMEENRLRYLVRMVALKERKLPALDDELAKDTGEYDTLEELTAAVEKRIIEAREQAEDQRMRLAVFDALREKNPLDLPPSILEKHTEAMKKQFFGGMQMPDEEMDDERKEQMKKLEEGTEKTARDMVHQHLLMSEIARHESIEVEDADIDAEIEKQAGLSGVPVPMLRAQLLGKDGRKDELQSQLLERKIFEHVRSVITVNEVDPPSSDESKSESTNQAKEKETKSSATKKSAAKKTPAKKTATKKAAAKKAPAEKKTAKKTAAKKTAKKSAAKKTAAKKPATKKSAAKKTAAKKSAAEK